MADTIMIVEDDQSIRFGLEEVLGAEGFEVVSCADGGPGVEELLKANSPALVLLDVMLPERSGFEICKSLRDHGVTVPILMLTAKGQELDKVIGLDAGADDYVTKPFGVRELVARIHALLRRARTPAELDTETCFMVGEGEVNPKTFEIRRGEETEPITPKELGLLQFLHGNRGEVMSRDRLLNEVWGVNYYGTTRTLDQTVAQLRKKIGDSGGKPTHLLTVHGVGYKLI